MWMFFATFSCILVHVTAVPTKNDFIKNFQTSLQHQDLHSILMSIEQRLRNLDTIYSLHLSSTLEEKLDLYQRKLDSIDTKIIQLESLMMLNLDNISENISTKNFKDDIFKTNLVKKVDSLYDSISHRLNYIEKKFETNTHKIQGKLDTTLTRLEKMDESFTARNEEIEIELSDAIAAIDDLKSSCTTMEENIVNNTNENFEISLKEQMLLMKSFNDKTKNVIHNLYQNTTKAFQNLEQKIGMELDAINETNRFLKSLKIELKTELNEYAVKVAEMNSENWKTGSLLQNKQRRLEYSINSTKAELQNGIKNLMFFIRKISKQDVSVQSDQSEISKLKETLEENFEKVFSAQNLFIDSCYRLQMDESQIESKISDILEKLIETFEKKTTIEIKDIKNLENVIKSHDAHIARNLYQANTNIITVFEKMIKNHKEGEGNMKHITDRMNDLHTLIQDALNDKNQTLVKNVTFLLNNLKEIEEKITSQAKRDYIILTTMNDIKATVDKLQERNSSEITEYFKKISQVITEMKAKINTMYLYYYFNKSKIHEVHQNLTNLIYQLLNNTNVKISEEMSTSNSSEHVQTSGISEHKIDKLITQIFGKPEVNSTQQTLAKAFSQTPQLVKIIDVRTNFETDGNSTEGVQELTEVTTKQILEKSDRGNKDEIIDFTEQII